MAATKPSFEQSLTELEAIVRKLEGGNVELEQAISDYESGMKLKTLCEQKLADAKLRVEKVVAQSPANAGVSQLKTEPFEAGE